MSPAPPAPTPARPEVSAVPPLAPTTDRKRLRLASAAAGFSGHQACEALVPILVGVTIDLAIAPSNPGMLFLTLGLLCATFVVLLWVWRWGELTATRLYLGQAYTVRRSLIGRLLSPRSGFPDSPGRALSILSSDADESASAVWTISHAIASCVAVLTAAIALLLISPPLAALVLLGTPVLMVIMHVATRPLERRSGAEQSALADASALAGDLLSGLRTVKGLSAEDEAIRRFDAATDRSLTAALRAANAHGAFSGISSLISGIFLIVLAGISALAVVDGTLTPGQFVIVIGLAQFLQWPIASLGFVGAELARARASTRRIDDLASHAAGPGEARPHEAGHVTIAALPLPSGAHLTTTIDPGDLVGLSLDAPDSAAVAERFAARIVDGTVAVDGAPLAAPPAAGKPPRVVAPPHDATLFAGTVRDNVGVTSGEATEADIVQAAALDDILTAGGWSREVGERGRLLSGGQRQRVALARALATQAPVLVLSEPATSVDAVTLTALARGIRETRRGRTTILLTANPALLAVCDRTLRLGDDLQWTDRRHTGEQPENARDGDDR